MRNLFMNNVNIVSALLLMLSAAGVSGSVAMGATNIPDNQVNAERRQSGMQIVDEESGRPLPRASILDRKGNPVGQPMNEV